MDYMVAQGQEPYPIWIFGDGEQCEPGAQHSSMIQIGISAKVDVNTESRLFT